MAEENIFFANGIGFVVTKRFVRYNFADLVLVQSDEADGPWEKCERKKVEDESE